MPETGSIHVSVRPHEIAFPGTPIVIESRDPVDPESAQGAVAVRGYRGRVRLSAGGRRMIWQADPPLPPGQHVLVLGELTTRSGTKITAKTEIPFFVTDSKAKIPSRLRVESIARVRVHRLQLQRLPADRRPAGKFVELIKATDRRSEKPADLAFDERGRRVSGADVVSGVLKARVQVFGKLHETLQARIRRARPGERIPVAVWIKAPASTYRRSRQVRAAAAGPPRAVLNHRRRVAEASTRAAQRFEREFGARRVRADRLAPVVFAEMAPDRIRALARLPEIDAIFFYEREGIEDLADSIAVANSDDVHSLGVKGSGVKVAVWESGPDDTSQLTIAAFYDPAQSSTSDHARHTHAIVKNKEKSKPHGHAPSCSLYSANDKDLDALTWAVKEKGCTVISQSFHRSSEPKSADLSFDDIHKDWLALHWPYPTILQAAGNYWQGDPDNINPPSNEYVNHKGYNSLAIGNHDDDADLMSGSSVFRNPSSPHGDRELPEMAANGTGVTTVGLTKSGTSMAAPAAAGVVALLQSASSTLKWWPEGCRAILLAGARVNVSGNTWWNDVIANVDASDGSGALEGLESFRIAQARRWRNAAATRRGWDVGSLVSGDFGTNGNSTFAYKVKVPAIILGPRRVKVALAWSSRVDTFRFPILDLEIPLSSHLAVDLDLKVYDSNGNLIGYSGSWDNSYEIAEFAGAPGAEYTIRIRRWSGTGRTYYGIAWTVTGGLRILPVDVSTIASRLE